MCNHGWLRVALVVCLPTRAVEHLCTAEDVPMQPLGSGIWQGLTSDVPPPSLCRSCLWGDIHFEPQFPGQVQRT